MEVDRNDGPGALADGVGDASRIDVRGARVRFHRNHLGAGAGDGEPGGDEGVRRYDDLVALADSQGIERQPEGVESAADADAETGAAELGVGLLERCHMVSEDVSPRVVEAFEGAQHLVPQLLVERIQGEKGHPVHEPLLVVVSSGSSSSERRMTKPGRPLTSS